MVDQSGFDIKVIVNELNDLSRSRIEKFYNTPEGELLIKIYSSKFGKITLRALRGECIHLTSFKREVADNPSNFTMYMRKYLNGSIIEEVTQPSFERIVIIKVRKGEQAYNIIIELFNKGNVIVCDEKMLIIRSLKSFEVKDRIIRTNENYELPQPKFQELYLDSIEFKRCVKSSSRESLVKALAVDLGMGGKYAEELCALSGLDKNKDPGMLSNSEAENLFKIFFIMYKSVKHYKNMRPCVIVKDEEIINFSPFPFKSYQDCEFKFFDSYNEACDYYYSNTQKGEIEEEAKNVYDNKINNLENRMQKQEDNLEYLKKESERLSKLGEIVFANYDLINTILTKLMQANKNNVEWSKIKEMIENEKKQGSIEAKAINSINEEQGIITLEIEGEEFNVKMTSNATDIAQEFFEKSKKMKNKISGTEESIEITKNKINNIEDEGIEFEEKIVENKKSDKEWFKKYRWLKTSNNFLLVCGRDATQNEILVKKVAEDNDLLFHTESPGSPFGILKNGKMAENEDKQECALFITSYSKAWKESVPTDVFCVSKEQVSKTAPSGEYVAHGSFIIKGGKEFYRGLWPDLRIGYNSEGEIIAGPSNLIKKRCEESVVLHPGNISPGKIATRLINIFDKNFRSEELLQFIPGDSMIEQ